MLVLFAVLVRSQDYSLTDPGFFEIVLQPGDTLSFGSIANNIFVNAHNLVVINTGDTSSAGSTLTMSSGRFKIPSITVISVYGSSQATVDVFIAPLGQCNGAFFTPVGGANTKISLGMDVPSFCIIPDMSSDKTDSFEVQWGTDNPDVIANLYSSVSAPPDSCTEWCTKSGIPKNFYVEYAGFEGKTGTPFQFTYYPATSTSCVALPTRAITFFNESEAVSLHARSCTSKSEYSASVNPSPNVTVEVSGGINGLVLIGAGVLVIAVLIGICVVCRRKCRFGNKGWKEVKDTP